MRRRGQAARALTLTLRFAGGTSREKTRRLAEPSAHDDDLRQLAHQLMDAAGLHVAVSPGSPCVAKTSSTPTGLPNRSASTTTPARAVCWPSRRWTASAASPAPPSSDRRPSSAVHPDQSARQRRQAGGLRGRGRTGCDESRTRKRAPELPLASASGPAAQVQSHGSSARRAAWPRASRGSRHTSGVSP
ncbi:hypothetical protein ACIG0D_22405 [Streptomyces sp. NPDC052773]|uniref:DinB/UmuC family translesion DNA polymerase n=1 Tax=Streptomyces sp. NPDC052773 TaxID=3365693 RepID=UPI0037D91619